MPPILQPGHNCWRADRADRFACIQDAADYFRLVRQAILQARDTIFIVGWDIQATLDLMPGGAPDNAPTRLDDLLKWVVRARPELRCYILTWDYAALYSLERDPFIRWRLGWRMPRQVRFGLDNHHPLGGSHHQKVVVIDDALAFCGGIDLTGHRWDTTAHRVCEPLRINAAGEPYGPYHEVQAMADGAVAASLGALVRDRWHALGESPRARAATPPRGLWPDDVTPDLTDVDVAIARTMPPSERDNGARECEQLFLDTIAAAERCIYIESQYFTNDRLGRALGERLQEPDGPELLLVIPKECHGWLEQQTMGALRAEALRQLTAADRYGRLRVVYPAASRPDDVPTFVHSKVMIVDDRLVRIGSANFSRRSMGVDSECDLAADAGDDPRRRAAVGHIRDRLVGEHLGMPADEVGVESARLGSLRALVDARVQAVRTLLPVNLNVQVDPPSEALKAAADPDVPIDVAVGAAVGFPAVAAAGASVDASVGAAVGVADGASARVSAGGADMIPPLGARADRGALKPWLPAIAAGVALLALSRVRPHGRTAAAGLLGVGALAYAARSVLLMRRVSSATRRHRERAEFG